MPKKILLADDSITIQKVVELTFSDGDYEVTAVNNGAKAIQKLSELRPDIILSDIIMPEKNGYEVCEFVKSHPDYRTIPVVLLTGTFEPFDPDRADKAGCDAVVTKPFESQSLIHKVEELIQASKASAPAPAAPAPSPFAPAEAESPFAAAPAFSPAPAANDPFGAAPDVFSDTTPGGNPPTTEMPFAQSEESFGETRAFPRMTFEDMQRMAGELPPAAPPAAPPPPPPAPAPAAEASPWDDAPAFGGETRAFPAMSFDEMQKMVATPAAASAPPPAPAAPEASPWDEPPATGGETRAFPAMSFDELQKLAATPAAASAPPPPPAASPWDEAPAAGNDSSTRAFPAMSFDELQKLASSPASSAAAPAEPEASPWDEAPAPPPPAAAEPAPWEDTPAFSGETRAFPRMSFEEMQQMANASAAPAPQPEPEPEPEPEPLAMAEPEPEPEPEPVMADAFPTAVNSQITDDVVTAASIPSAAGSGMSGGLTGDLTDEQIDRIARRVVQMMSEQVVRNIAWEVIPDLAEMVVKERIKQLESEA